MKAADYIIDWLEKMVNKYPFLYFKYEYLIERKRHIICAYPRYEIDRSEAYCEDEMAFYAEVDELFPGESILISDEERLFSCSANALEIHHSSKYVVES